MMTEFTAHFSKSPLPRLGRRAHGGIASNDATFAHEQPSVPAALHSDPPVRREEAPRFDEMLQQTRAEMEEARDSYARDARRLRVWQWWFVGMFTFYTTLVGILALKLVTSQ
jgi:hypothetical protein